MASNARIRRPELDEFLDGAMARAWRTNASISAPAERNLEGGIWLPVGDGGFLVLIRKRCASSQMLASLNARAGRVPSVLFVDAAAARRRHRCQRGRPAHLQGADNATPEMGDAAAILCG